MFPFLSLSFFVYVSFAHINAMKLRKTAINMTVSIKYALIKSFKGFELCVRYWEYVLLFFVKLGTNVVHIKIHMFELLKRKSKFKIKQKA